MTTSLTCPRCRADLQVKMQGAAVAAGCPSCGGVWLGADATETVRAVLHPKASEVAQHVAATAAKHAVDDEEVARCAVCGDHMRRLTIGDVEVDHCPTDGTWYDLGELERVAVLLDAKARGAAVEVSDAGVPGPKAVDPGVARSAMGVGPGFTAAVSNDQALELDVRGRNVAATGGGAIAAAEVPEGFGQAGVIGHSSGFSSGLDGDGLDRAKHIASICRRNGADQAFDPDPTERRGIFGRRRDDPARQVLGLLGSLLDF